MSTESSSAVAECLGWRDEPQSQEQGSDRTCGFRLRGIIQFFFLRDHDLGGHRKHSCIELWWQSTGTLDMVRLDNYRGGIDVVPTTLWGVNGRTGTDVPTQTREDDMLNDLGCPEIFPPESSSVSSSANTFEHKTAGCIVSVMALRGSYGNASSSVSSTMESSCVGTRKVHYPPHQFICNGIPVEEIDPTLESTATELMMEFDSTGHLKRVFWGGMWPCDDNPCVWDRDKPPPGTAGVIVPVLQFITDTEDNDYRVYQIHFDSTGRWLKACPYATLRECELDSSSGESDPQRCPCLPYACVYLPDCIETIHYSPPESVFFPCSEALAGGEDCPSSAQEDTFCEYVHTGLNCTESSPLETVGEGTFHDSMGPDPGGRTPCFYANGTRSCEPM